ncbi:MAG: CRTAC1 family protein [Bryobacteraceae bacterium]
MALLGAAIRFEDVAASSGLQFVLENHPTPEKHLIETMAGGLAAFDYDGDGRVDLFFANGATIPLLRKDSAKYYNRLFHNEGSLKFRDVTAETGVAGEGYSMGAAVADFDNDGRPDLFVSGVYRNTLYRNMGGGKFEDVTAKSGIKSDRWSVTAGWFDYDNDGLLDLLVVNYAHWKAANPRFCGDAAKGIRVYCHPKYFDPVPNQLYHNRGDGTFEDVSSKSGIGSAPGRGMGVAFADYDGDGRIDAFVTNDGLPNSLFRNTGNGKFEETALLAGVALQDHGRAVASMGADFRDYDNDGRPDIAVTALAGETFPLFHNESKGVFRDAGFASGLARLVSKRSGWGIGFVDFDNDGWKDLFAAQSHVNDQVEKFEASRYKEPNGVYANIGGKFRDDSATFGPVRAHRGAAFADFDGDGRIDIAVSALGEPAELWRNVTVPSGHWVRFRLRGTRSNRDGIGAEIHLGKQWNSMTSAVSYSSSSLIPVHFGLGSEAAVTPVEIRWPSGVVQRIERYNADQENEIVEPRP